MPAPALLRRLDVPLPRPRARSALVATAIVTTTLSLAVFAAVTATGGPAIVGSIGPAGPFADLHHALTLSLTRDACLLAAASGGAAVLAGLAAVRRGCGCHRRATRSCRCRSSSTTMRPSTPRPRW